MMEKKEKKEKKLNKMKYIKYFIKLLFNQIKKFEYKFS